MTKRIDWDRVGLGARPDREIAREFGVHHSVVARMRYRRRIASFDHATACPMHTEGRHPATVFVGARFYCADCAALMRRPLWYAMICLGAKRPSMPLSFGARVWSE